MSNADHIFNQANRGMVTTGMDGWEVIQDYSDADTVRPRPNNQKDT